MVEFWTLPPWLVMAEDIQQVRNGFGLQQAGR